MGPAKRGGGSSSGEYNLSIIGASLRSGTINERKDALDNLLFYFNHVDKRWSQGPNQKPLTDKEYHSLLEALFACTLLEKQSYFGARRGSKSSSGSRLERCAEALRVVVSHGAAKIKRKTARAVVDHISQVLPGPDDDFVAPLLPDYTKAFLALLDRPANVENFAVAGGHLWLSCVDFCLLALSRSLESAGGRASSSSSVPPASPAPTPAPAPALVPAPGGGPVPGPQTLSLAFSTARSASPSSALPRPPPPQQRPGAGSRHQTAEHYLSGLHMLLRAPQAPLLDRAADIVDVALRILQARRAKLGSLHQAAFATVNAVLARLVQADDVARAQSWARDLIPLLAHWWPSRALFRDALSNAVRDEMLKTMLAIQPFLESLVTTTATTAAAASSSSSPPPPPQEPPPAEASLLLRDVEDLLDTLWAEYSRREDRARLQLDDLTFTRLRLPQDHPGTGVFRMQPHRLAAEQNWALLECLAALELLHLRGARPEPPAQRHAEDEQPRKKRRMTSSNSNNNNSSSSRILQKLATSDNSGAQLTALQLVPFLCRSRSFSADESRDALDALLVLVTDNKQASTASWAMLACASLANTESARDPSLSALWRQLWQLGVRAVSLPETSRAACALLHSLLASDLVPRHHLVDEIHIMVTNSDISGPAVLVDSSLVLMLHLLAIRNLVLPNASDATSSHIIRWVFVKWNPADLMYASLHSHLVPPFDLVNLLRACCGVPLLRSTRPARAPAGAIGQFWKGQKEHRAMLRYLLLLDRSGPDDDDADDGDDDNDDDDLPAASSARKSLQVEDLAQASSAGPEGSHTAKRLVLELLSPKIEELVQLSESWTRRGGGSGGGGSSSSSGDAGAVLPISKPRLQSAASACLVGAQLLPELTGLPSSLSRDVEPLVSRLEDTVLRAVTEAADRNDDDDYGDILLATVCPYLPDLTTTALRQLRDQNRFLLSFFARLSDAVQARSGVASSGGPDHADLMDLDDDELVEPQRSQRGGAAAAAAKQAALPRRDVYLAHTPEAVYLEARLRLRHLAILHAAADDDSQIGLVPERLVDDLLGLPTDHLLCGGRLLRQLFASDLVTAPPDVRRVIETVGAVLGRKDYAYCEAALCLAIGVMEGCIHLWTAEDGDRDRDNHHHHHDEIAAMVGDLYNHLVKYALPQGELSPAAQEAFARLLFRLLEVRPTYAAALDLPSCRSTLLAVLRDGCMRVQYRVGRDLPHIFRWYVLKTHDDIFVDILASLPADPASLEGIALRLFVLAELACRWSTLLRRCVYHIFETPGRIRRSARHAARCVAQIAAALRLDAPRALFGLFAPQLLYTWLSTDPIEDIPYETFGFATLRDLLAQAQAEAAALMLMRGQEQAAERLAQALGLTPAALVRRSFAKIVAYSIAHDIGAPGSSSSSSSAAPRDPTATTTTTTTTAESRVRKMLGGREPFLESIYLHFADIVAVFFGLFDQEDPVEKAFRRDASLAYAADIMDEIKRCGHLDAGLPPNQQPTFRAKHLPRQLARLCSRTEYEMRSLWSPALVVAVARRLLDAVHPALGPLHACAVLRKIRVLLCLAGPQALASYPLEMLLHAIRAFVRDPECADDALGMSRYLIERGAAHLGRAPSFLAGYALSVLADLRVFLESSQARTTQDSQFRATRSRAQLFHAWFADFLAAYESPAFRGGGGDGGGNGDDDDDEQRAAFRAITQAAVGIRAASGNAEKGTPESRLLLEILRDGDRDRRRQLLNQPARDVALDLLCGAFQIPASHRRDVVETDEDALSHGAVVWKSCRSPKLSDAYLAWAGRVVGRSFAASGDVPDDLLRESRLAEYGRLCARDGDGGGGGGSESGILGLVQALTVSSDGRTAGLAESALRTVVSDAVAEGDRDLLAACQTSLSEPLLLSSNWDPYRTPPSDYAETGLGGPAEKRELEAEAFGPGSLESPAWARHVATYLARSVGEDVVLLRVLPPLLAQAKGFAEQSFPFVVHLVLLAQLDRPQQQGAKRQLSEALRRDWLGCAAPAARENLQLLLNALLYLRTQPFPREASIADRAHWLDVDLAAAAAAAARCGMYKVALLFAELAFSGSAPSSSSSSSSSSSRRSSAAAARDMEDSADLLLDIFENIDDPDAYYGLAREASLATVLSRLEYERDGTKSLAFRGAQYDSHLRSRDAAAAGRDGQQLVRALASLGLSGLSHSLLQAQQQSLDGGSSSAAAATSSSSSSSSSSSADATFTLARRLEIWNLPAPPSVQESHAVTLYKAYQAMHKSGDVSAVRAAIHDGLRRTVARLASQSLNVYGLRDHLAALAALSELDDLVNVSDAAELEDLLAQFRARSKWMMSGRYGDVSQILSCRETALSLLSQQHRLRASGVSPADARLVQIRSLLLSSDIFRFHRATQESLNISTCLTDLIRPSEALGLAVDAAVRVEAAHALWDHGEMISSIRMLQGIDRDAAAAAAPAKKKQQQQQQQQQYTVPVSRADLLAQIAHQVSVARLESADRIQRQYLEPALKELRGRSEGREAGRVHHQFATFCDEQLQNPDGLEDLQRLRGLERGKSEEVEQLRRLIATTTTTGDAPTRGRYASHLAKALQWLELDRQELRRVEQTRGEFVRLSLENYLRALAASDEHDSDALRFAALWLERSGEAATQAAVARPLERVPTRKFAPLMNQLSSRLQLPPPAGDDDETAFQRLLAGLVYRICVDHPYHGMYQIWSGCKARTNTRDAVAVSRQKATEQVAGQLARTTRGAVAQLWHAIDRTSRYYHQLAMDRDPDRYRAGQKVALRDSAAGRAFLAAMAKYPIPPPTLRIELSPRMDYAAVPVTRGFEPHMAIASGVSAPKILTALGSDGRRYKQLVKGGNDDLRQDAIMEQVFAAVSDLLRRHRAARQRGLGIRTYKVLPLTASSGLIEFVPDTVPLHEYLMPAHERYHPRDLKGSQCRREIAAVQTKPVDARVAAYRRVTERFHPVLRYYFLEYFPDPDAWFVRRTAYTRSTAAISMLGHVLGVGDRHGHNILLDTRTGEVVHIDLGVAFEAGRILPVPELVPFRLTRDIVDGMGITRTEGVFRRCCEVTLDALREETYSIMTILDVLRYDPLYSWSISPVRMAKLQTAPGTTAPPSAEEQQQQQQQQEGVGTAAAAGDERGGPALDEGEGEAGDGGGGGRGRGKLINEPSEAHRALEVVRKKLSKTLSVTATVNDLINQATDERNLAVLYSGWAAYA